MPHAQKSSPSKKPATESAILAGGCFWCLEAVFKRLKGVSDVQPGYTGGQTANPSYEAVTSGRTGHAEAIEITFNPAIITYETLLDVFFAIHDPTTLNRQGNDVGSQYRSTIFYINDGQQAAAKAAIERLERSGRLSDPIVTEVSPAGSFYAAEDYHRDYYDSNRQNAYCRLVIDPKIRQLFDQFGGLTAGSSAKK